MSATSELRSIWQHTDDVSHVRCFCFYCLVGS